MVSSIIGIIGVSIATFNLIITAIFGNVIFRNLKKEINSQKNILDLREEQIKSQHKQMESRDNQINNIKTTIETALKMTQMFDPEKLKAYGEIIEKNTQKKTELELSEQMSTHIDTIRENFKESVAEIVAEKREIYSQMRELRTKNYNELKSEREKNRKELDKKAEDYKKSLREFMEKVSEDYKTNIEKVIEQKNELMPIIISIIFSIDESQRDFFIKKTFPLNAEDFIKDIDAMSPEDSKFLEQKLQSTISKVNPSQFQNK